MADDDDADDDVDDDVVVVVDDGNVGKASACSEAPREMVTAWGNPCCGN
jgi:hypothetical protein